MTKILIFKTKTHFSVIEMENDNYVFTILFITTAMSVCQSQHDQM